MFDFDAMQAAAEQVKLGRSLRSPLHRLKAVDSTCD